MAINFYFVAFIMDHVRAEIALAVGEDMASINRIKSENGDDPRRGELAKSEDLVISPTFG
jgi:hypothetical protein